MGSIYVDIVKRDPEWTTVQWGPHTLEVPSSHLTESTVEPSLGAPRIAVIALRASMDYQAERFQVRVRPGTGNTTRWVLGRGGWRGYAGVPKPPFDRWEHSFAQEDTQR
jgi:hypothetical protein